jgi:hypothetical protein
MGGLALALVALGAHGAQPTQQADALDRLGALAGEWQADLPGFGKLVASIHWVSNGKAIEEIIGTPEDNEVSIYTRDGKRILVTHFCAMTPDGHIVRMSTAELSGAPSRLEFSFLGATNLHDESAPHMMHLVTTLADHNHFDEKWTKSEGGKTVVFDLRFVRR